MSTLWARYVKRVAGTDNQSEIARATGIGQPNIHRWLAGGQPSLPLVAKFALAYDENPVKAMVLGGLLDERDAGAALTAADRAFISDLTEEGEVLA